MIPDSTDTGMKSMGGNLRGNRLMAAACLLLLGLAAGGCMVASTKYDVKTREADTLRDALANTNKEKTVLEARNDALQTQLTGEKEEVTALSARFRTQEEEIRRINEELASARKNYEGTRITREQFISELLEKEKTTGKRIQELSAKAQSCEQVLEAHGKDGAARETELSDLRKKVEKPQETEALRRERDILLGRVERLSEERKQEEKRREERFADLVEYFGKVSADIKSATLGPTLRIYLPERILFLKGKAGLSDGGRKVLGEVGKAASEFSTSSILLSTGGKKTADEISTGLNGQAKIPADRIFQKYIEKDRGAEILLLIP